MLPPHLRGDARLPLDLGEVASAHCPGRLQGTLPHPRPQAASPRKRHLHPSRTLESHLIPFSSLQPKPSLLGNPVGFIFKTHPCSPSLLLAPRLFIPALGEEGLTLVFLGEIVAIYSSDTLLSFPVLSFSPFPSESLSPFPAF